MSTLAERMRLADMGRSTTVDVRESTRTASSPAPVDPVRTGSAATRASVVKALGDALAAEKLSPAELRAKATTLVQAELEMLDTPLSAAERAALTSEIVNDLVGYGPLEPLLADPSVTEIMTCGPHELWVERNGKTERVSAEFTDDAHLRRVVDRIVTPLGRRLDESSPVVDARLPDGSRVHVIIAPLAVHGTALTIRKFSRDSLGIEDLVSLGTLSHSAAEFLVAAVEAKLSILIAGGTGAGKTSTLNALASCFGSNERIVTVEDLFELQLTNPHWIPLEARPANIEGKGEITLNALVKQALRMRPDRLVVGEIRDGHAALEMLQAMNTGHEGSLGTVHANSPRETFSRVDGMVALAGIRMESAAVYRQMASAIDIIVYQRRMRDGSRAITHITEVTGMEGDVPSLQDIYVRPSDATGAKGAPLAPTGTPPTCLQRISDAGVSVDRGMFFTHGPASRK